MATARSLRYLRYDVFTDTAFAGNPLAVVIEPPPLTDDQHQRIATELNLSETIFLRRRGGDADGGWDARIFTPGTEVAFAGHPTVGAALALADEGLIARPTEPDVPGGAPGRVGGTTLHEGVGPVRVVVVDDRARFTRTDDPVRLGDVDRGLAAASLGLQPGDLHPGVDPAAWSAGLPYAVVAVADLDVLARARLRPGAEHDLDPTGGDGTSAYVVCPLDGPDGARWRARMFAPGLGVAEDPATGSAVAALYGLVARPPDWPVVSWEVVQGVEMGRPSRIHLNARIGEHGTSEGYEIEGAAVRVGSGQLVVPPTA